MQSMAKVVVEEKTGDAIAKVIPICWALDLILK